MLGKIKHSEVELSKNGWSFQNSNTVFEVVQKSIDKLRLLSYLSIHIKLFEIGHDFSLLLRYYIQKLDVEEGMQVGLKVELEIVVRESTDECFW